MFQIWQVNPLPSGGVAVEVLCDLVRHNRAVNAVRFSPDGNYLASADDGMSSFLQILLHLKVFALNDQKLIFVCSRLVWIKFFSLLLLTLDLLLKFFITLILLS